ncbi:hypothetical protein [Nonlabens sp.]|uniref:hypothetical protein n=1 Tax=Nonlabens sp. TaxID=1888209 RepID=UPI003267873C
MRKKYSLIKAVRCSITKHNYQVSHVVNERVQEMCCTKCGKQITNTIYGEVVPLNDLHSQINEALNDMARKRQKAGLQVSYS